MAEDNIKEDNLTGLDQFSLDKIAGVKMGGIQPKTIDTGGIDKQIAALEKPAGGSVYDKMAARYRSQGEGAVLRTQKNLANLFSPTINLIQEREAAAQNRFTLLKDKLPEFDDSTIFGHQSGNPMPIVEEIKNISKITREDMRMLSRLNVNDERYDEIRKRIEKNQDAIVAFDAINEKLLEIRNSQDGREDDSQWSRGMDPTTRRMWDDIYASNGQNIKVQDGKLVWISTGGKSEEIKTKSKALNNISSIVEVPTEEKDVKKLQKNLQDLGYDIGITGVDGKYGSKTKAAYEKFLQEKEDIQSEIGSAKLEGVGETRTIDLNEIGDGPTMIDNIGITKDTEVQSVIQELINKNVTVNTPGYESQVNALIRTINSVGPKGIKSLIFDGFGAEQGDVLKSTNTDSFIEQIIQNNPEEFGIEDVENLTQEEIANAYDIMRSRDVTYSYSNDSGESQTLQSQYLQWYRKQIDNRVKQGIKTGGRGSGGDDQKLTDKITNFEFSNIIDNTEGGYLRNETYLPPMEFAGDTYEKAELFFTEGKINLTLDMNLGSKGRIKDLPIEKTMELLQELYPNTSKDKIKDYVNSQIKISKDKQTEVIKNLKTTENTSLNNSLNNLLKKNVDIGGRTPKDYLLTYGDDEFVINSLNREFGKHGFTFRYGTVEERRGYVLGLPAGLSDKDLLFVSHKNKPKVERRIRFDNSSESKDLEKTRNLIGIMNAMYNNDYIAVSEDVK